MMSKIKKSNNINGMNEELFYCGMWKFNEIRTKIIKFLLLFQCLVGINKACYIHDKHYNLLFNAQLGIFNLLKYKIIVDTIFLYNCFKYALENKESKIKIPYRLCLAVFFYFFVLFMTPYYYYVYRAKK